MLWKLPDLLAFQFGPLGQTRPLLDKLHAAGRQHVYAEAEQVSIVGHMVHNGSHGTARCS